MRLLDRVAMTMVLSYAAAAFTMVASEHRPDWFVTLSVMPMLFAGGRLISR